MLRSTPPHTGSPGTFGPGTLEESEKSPERVPRARAPKVLRECTPESQKSPKRVRKSGFRLFSDSFETLGHTLSALLGVLFLDSFRTFLGFRALRAREALCGAGSIAIVVKKRRRKIRKSTLQEERPDNFPYWIQGRPKGVGEDPQQSTPEWCSMR